MRYIIIVLFLAGCVKKGSDVKTQNSVDDFKVKLLFEADGCKVYRFEDIGSSKYFTNCGKTQWTESCGKNCTEREEVN